LKDEKGYLFETIHVIQNKVKKRIFLTLQFGPLWKMC